MLSGQAARGQRVAFLFTEGVEQVELTEPLTPSARPARMWTWSRSDGNRADVQPSRQGRHRRRPTSPSPTRMRRTTTAS